MYTATVALARREVWGVPDGRGDVNGLLVSRVAGASRLLLPGA